MATQKALARQQVGDTGTANVLRDQKRVHSKESKLTYTHTHTHTHTRTAAVENFLSSSFLLIVRFTRVVVACNLQTNLQK